MEIRRNKTKNTNRTEEKQDKATLSHAIERVALLAEIDVMTLTTENENSFIRAHCSRNREFRVPLSHSIDRAADLNLSKKCKNCNWRA